MDRFFAALTGKPATRICYGNVRRNLEDHFGKDKPIRDITTADADAWRAWMVEHEKLATPTISRRVTAARTIWHKAMRWKLASENPFIGVKGGTMANESRKVFVSRETIISIIEKCPDTEWKAIIALARYGGLRIPSEAYALRWGDIDWERGTIRVPCPKLEHNEHFASRIIPLFPELREHLLKLFDEAEAGAEYVIVKHRFGSLNLRATFERIIERAGVQQWAKLFHNLRASRESELMREYDLSTVCKWIGNSPAIAAKHYAMSIDLNADFQRATGAAQKAAQYGAKSSATEGKSESDDAQNHSENTADCTVCASVQSGGMGRIRLERMTSSV
ncbi:MAG: tyrosine-type recombinase/integrase [Tepidisphaeraceae bacterium]